MSEGPIKSERDAWKPQAVSTRDSARICYKKIHQPRAYCGRKPREAVDSWREVTCSDCFAASRADLASPGSGEADR